jgi:hypothetical protein
MAWIETSEELLPWKGFAASSSKKKKRTLLLLGCRI